MKHYQKLLSLLVFSSLGIYAADNSAENDAQVAESTEQAEEGAEGIERPLEETIPDAGDEIILDASDENFVPSEQITEDLPVAFPIDI